APVVVFMHGYSAYNPMVFGGWISHLVRKGNIVVFPRYQKNLFTPSPDQFVSNTATAIKNALKELKSGDHVRPSDAPVCMVGHSFGGAIIANMSTEWEALGIPKPAGIMLVSPGTGPFRSFELPSYEKIPFDTKMLVVVSENDRVVGEDFGTLIFNTATKTPERNLLRQLEEQHKNLSITAGHNEVYAVDKKFDNGIHGHSYRKAQFSVINP